MKTRRIRAFTLIELLVVITIISILVSLAVPKFDGIIERARTMQCMANLRNIGVALTQYVAEHEGRIPYIENPAYPVYAGDPDTPDDIEPVTMLEAFSPYDVTEKTLKCPEDTEYFSKNGSSYEWRPFIDGEPAVAPKMLSRRGGGLVTRDAWRITVVSDYNRTAHYGHSNRLKADGSVVIAKPTSH